MKLLISITAGLFLVASPVLAKKDVANAPTVSKQELQAAKKAERQAIRAERKAARQARKAARNAEKSANKTSGKGKRANPQDPTNALAAKAVHTETLLAREDVHAVGVSWKANGQAVVKVLVDNKTTKQLGLEPLPKKLDGISVVKQNSGPVYALNVPCEDRKYKKACIDADDQAAVDAQLGDGTAEAVSPADWHERPVPIGVSIGTSEQTPGTLGCRVSRGCHNYALTSSHVIAGETAPDAMLQPGAFDGGIIDEDSVARLLEATQIILGTGPEVANRADASIFDIEDNSVGTATRSNGYGNPRAITTEASLSLDVMKYGRSSAMTSGYIDAIDATVIVNYPEGPARFVNQLLIRSKQGKVDFALPGDSGSLVVAELGDAERKPVGLVFASGKNVTVANPIDEVLYALDIEIDGDFE